LFRSAWRQIIALAAEHNLPVMYEGREFVEDGGLISYGPDIVEMTRRSATFVDKTLKGADPANLPIEQPTRFELPQIRSVQRPLASTCRRFCSPVPMR
jgi:ABC-type uncharacterized transport system substrate-binding protein